MLVTAFFVVNIQASFSLQYYFPDHYEVQFVCKFACTPRTNLHRSYNGEGKSANVKVAVPLKQGRKGRSGGKGWL